ncbi:fimbrial protein [Salinivibrio sp. YCSC6]|uniref:fimbrial protein n=1 Tax=Salinivibrio sp. YCSC6 TaxID=2003370 RepID=UPI000BBBDA8F|nr:fimbrial protein [Salinivibrio sp. YCSC6]PCE65484.1 hypothetical protein B6G00_16070 [Salinivibrio sp. YCSC6]QCF37484.1 type 1 fimbrial protein [Salinivibrio sp. YCSC6]
MIKRSNIIILLGLFVSNQNASALSLEISGKIKHPTCQVKINNIRNSPVINLPSISINQLKDRNSVETTFELKIYDCLRSLELVQHWDVRFSPWGIDRNRESLIPGFIPMISGTADNIGLQILDQPSGSPIANEFNSGTLIGYRLRDAIQIPPGQDQGVHTFAVRYLPLNDTPQPGTLTSYLQYSIIYD